MCGETRHHHGLCHGLFLFSAEIEQERQIQRPASARARKHRLHPDLVRFVATAVLPPGSQAWQPAFSTLSDTTAATFIDLAAMSSGSNYDLLATIDSARTIETSKSGPTAHTDAHQRPVQWVPTAIRDRSIAHMLVISPFEAQELYSRVYTSDTVALHLYAPRCNSDFRSLDRLDFYTFSRQVAASMIHPRLVVQLNLFAGQLYISDYEDFKYWVGEEDIPLLLLVGDGVLGKHIGQSLEMIAGVCLPPGRQLCCAEIARGPRSELPSRNPDQRPC